MGVPQPHHHDEAVVNNIWKTSLGYADLNCMMRLGTHYPKRVPPPKGW